jgi:hypothetical protein
MPFQWNEIQRNWLYDLPTSYSKEEIVKAFNQVEARFGSEFFDKYDWIRGNYIVTLIVDLAKILEETEKGHCELPYNGEIVQKIRRNDLYSASTLIRLAAYYLRHDLLVEFDPELLIRGRRKHPDLRVNFNQNWIYIEEASLYSSLHQKHVFSIMASICNAIELVSSSMNIEVDLLRDDLSYREVKQIIDKIRILCDEPDQPQELGIEDVARIFTYRKGQEKPAIKEKRPALCESALKVGNGVECHLNIQMFFTDKRVEKILKKSKQLSPREHNIVLLDISNEIVKLKEWSESLNKILQPNKHRRIGAVLLVEKARFIESLKVNSTLFTHPNPVKPLAGEFIQLTNDFFEQSPEYQYVRSIKHK